MKALAIRRGGGLLYGTNFSLGVQEFFRLTAELAKLKGYSFPHRRDPPYLEA